MKSESNLYEILGVSPTSEGVVIEGAYRALMRQYQPLVQSNADIAAKVQLINAAYSTLSNSRKRSLYDAGLKSGKSTSASNPPPTSAPIQAKPTPAEVRPDPRTESGSSYERPAYRDPNPNRRGIWIPVLIIGSVIWLMVKGADNGGADKLSELEINESEAVSNAVEEVKLTEPEPEPIVLDQEVSFADARNCVASPALDQVFEKLLPTSQTTGEILTPQNVRLGGTQLTPQLQDFVEANDPPGTLAKMSSVRLPKDATWHGLRASRLIATYYGPPETDSTYTRSITFRASPDEVREVLTAQGFNPPTNGNYSSLEDGVCGGSLEVLSVPGGTELKCSWGC